MVNSVLFYLGGVGAPELTESQKKLVEEDPAQTLETQENMKISGSSARHMVMQKLMRQAPPVSCFSYTDS